MELKMLRVRTLASIRLKSKSLEENRFYMRTAVVAFAFVIAARAVWSAPLQVAIV